MVIAQLSSVQQIHPVVDHKGEVLSDIPRVENNDYMVKLNDDV